MTAAPLSVTLTDWVTVGRHEEFRGAPVDMKKEDGATALMLACAGGRLEAAELLLEKGADRTLADNDGNTASFYADKKGTASFYCRGLLREYGSD